MTTPDTTYHITPSEAHELFRLDPETGRVYFRERALHWFDNSQSHGTWNTRFAGQETFRFLDKRKREYTGCIFGHTVRRCVLVWCLAHGAWPTHRIRYVNGDKTDTRSENLC